MTENEWIDACGLKRARSPLVKWAEIFSFGLLALVFLGMFLVHDDHVVSLLGTVLPCLMVASLFLFLISGFPLAHIRRLPGPKFLNAEQTWVFSDDGVFYQTDKVEYREQWSLYSKVEDFQEFYRLFINATFRPIPKRAFRSKEEERLFQHLIQRKLPNNLKS
jgi:hypothetical protein